MLPTSRITPRIRPSMADVGRLANVSAQTVSRFFTGTGYVSAATRIRIEAAVAELGYRPNHVARAFRVNRTNTIGVLTMGTINYGVSATYAGVTAAAHATDYSVVISHIDVDIDDPGALEEARRGLDTLQSLQVDGIILATQNRHADDLLAGISDQLPVVTLSGRPTPRAATVALDSYGAGLLATRYLIQLGHQRILHMGGPPNRHETIERERGYREAMLEAGLSPLPILPGTSWSPASGHAAGLAANLDDFTAVFAANDPLALGFMSAMRSRGFEAPGDYSIVGVDDMPETAFFAPPLTTMCMDFSELGSVAFEMIRHHIGTGKRLDLRVLPPVLVVRESAAPPRGGRSLSGAVNGAAPR